MVASYDNYTEKIKLHNYTEKIKLHPEYQYPRPNEYTNDQWLSYIYYMELGYSSIKRDRIYNGIVNQFSNKIGNEKILNRQLFENIIQWIKNTPEFKQRNFF